VITLYSLPGTKELESLSPFCMKVEVYLKLQQVPYKLVNGDPRKAPKGKLPTIDVDGTTVADSSAILACLEQKAERPLDRGLDAEARARAHVLKRTFEESLYFVLLWSRWADDDGWLELKKTVDLMVPGALRFFLPGVIRKKVVGSIVAQGTGRHSRDEIYALGRADLEAVSALLGDRPFLVDRELRTTDLIAYSFLASILMWPRPSPLTEVARGLPNLDAYVKRIGARIKGAR
jgi:glutathione S-transferase